ncbi:MAG: MalY/PatB family protein [Lachnospiraceae bacterium]|nr:MalY/PatB family protein [Lachnospiraceae bacterium]
MSEKIFDTLHFPDRRGTNCVKWDALTATYGQDNLLPLWVADMDFYAAPCVREAMRTAVDAGVFGYFAPPASYLDAFLDWERTRHGVSADRSWIRFTPGVVTGIFWTISALTEPGDGIAILTPCYYPFMNAVRETGRRMVISELVHTENGYTVDLADFEEKARTEQIRMLLLCSPHNPVGHVWSEQELRGMLDICKRYDILVVSDEIHQDVVFNGHRHLSCLRFEDILDRLILLTAASKAFNLAGLQNSFALIPNADLRKRFDAYVKTTGMRQGSSLGYIAAEAAYRGGAQWLDEVLDYLQGNYDLLKQRLTAAFPRIRIDPLEGTYMIWVDLAGCVAPDRLVEVVQNKARLAVDFGSWFWPADQVPEDDAHIRINIATPRANVELACERLIEAIKSE